MRSIIRKNSENDLNKLHDPRGELAFQKGNSRISVGRFTYGIEGCKIYEWGEGADLKIGSFCSLAADVVFLLGGNHRLDWSTTFPFGHIFSEILGGDEIVGHPSSNGNVSVGHDVWIGRNATIMSGVHIAHGAVIAANAHIIPHFPSNLMFSHLRLPVTCYISAC